MNKIQKHSLQLLIEFDEFCKKNDLEYCLAWGTLLGAIRHKGFIPWDDDVDVAMDSKNWAKFKDLVAQGKLPSHLRFEDTGFIPRAVVPKIRDLRSKAITDNTGREGYFLDIFPFKHYSSTEKAIIQLCSVGNRLRARRKTIRNRALRSIYGLLTLLPHEMSNGIKKIVFPWLKNKEENLEGEYFDKFLFLGPKEWFKYEDFYPFVNAKFEGYEFPVPHHWDVILRTRYGNYMEPVDYEKPHYR